MDVGLRRKQKTGVVAGSVWESRMKSDEFKGGIKVFNGEEEENTQNSNNDSQGNDDNKSTIEAQVDSKKVNSNMSPKQNVVVGTNGGGKRKTWKSESLEGSPIQIAKQRSDMVKNPDDKSKESNVSDNGIIKKTPIHNRKTRSMAMKEELRLSLDVLEKTPIQNKKTRSQSIKSPPELRKSKSESVKDLVKSIDENANNSPQSSKHCEENGESCIGLSNGVDERIEKGIVGITRTTISEENCEEKGIGSNVVPVKSPPKDVEDKEMEVENKSIVVKEISNVAEQKAKNNLVVKEKNFQPSNQSKPTVPPIVKKQSPSFESNAKVHLTSPSKPRPSTNGSHRIPRSHSKLQSIVDLVMWRDVSRTAFVFGTGTFFVISSSYTKDLNISLISVVSYVGLVYLAAIFLFRSFISRGSEMNDSTMDYIFGEEEAIRLVKLTLPFVNECLLNLKALFSGDPATTIKMAMMLYVLARCGSSITIWKMAKLSFFGVFTLPKICSSYSKHLTHYGAFWIRRFREGWESCTHKKAVAIAIFTLFWNLSSSIARIWAVFMLFVAFRFYQQSMIEEEEARFEYPSQPGPTQRQSTRPIFVDTGGKQKRIY